MGTDIHVCVVHYDGTRLTVVKDYSYLASAPDPDEIVSFADVAAILHSQRLTTERNYVRFSALSGVRHMGSEAPLEPNGWPPWAHHLSGYSAGDLHSHTHYPIRDAACIWLKTTPQYQKDSDDRAMLAIADPYWFYFGVDQDKYDLDEMFVLIAYDS